MKKTISILVILAMLLSSCMMLASCGAVSEKDIQKEPYKVLSAAWQKTLERYFTEDKKTAKVLEQISDKGKFTLAFDGSALDLGIPAIGATVYSDSKNQQMVAQLETNIEGTELGADIFLNNEMLALVSPTIFGNSDALAIFFETFLEDYKGSLVEEIVGADLNVLIESFKSVDLNAMIPSEAPGAPTQEEAEQNFKVLCETLLMAVSTDESGNLVVTLTINDETIEALSKTEAYGDIFTSMNPGNIMPDGSSIDIFEGLSADLSLAISIEPKDGYISEIALNGTVDYKGAIFSVDSSLKLAAESIVLNVTGSADGQSFILDVKLTKSVTSEQTSHNLVVSAGTGNVSAKLFDATYTKAKNGDISFTLDLIEDEVNTVRFGFKGKYETSDKKLSFSVNELTMADETFNFTLSVTAEAVESIPAFPENAKNVITMTAEDWEKIGEDLKSGPLGSIFGNEALPE